MSLSFTDNSRVVLIGIPETPDLEAIPHATRSVEKLKSLLRSDEVVGLKSEQVVELPQQNRESVSDVLEDFRKACQEAKGAFLFYYCGHGLYGDEQSELYLTLKGSTDTDKQVNALKIRDLKAQMSQSPAKTRVMILDCCYSGAALEGGMSGEQDVIPALSLSGTYAMASVPPNDKARFIAEDEYPIFSGELIKSLEFGIEKAGEYLSIDEIFEHVREKVSSRGDVAPPVKEERDTAGSIVFAKNKWAFKSSDMKEILSRLVNMDGIIANLSGRLNKIEDEGLPERDTSSTLRMTNLMTFFLIIFCAIGVAYSNQAYGFPSLRLFFFVTLMISFLSLAPGRSMDHVIPKEISRSTIFWGCLLAGCILGSVDKQLERDFARIFPIFGEPEAQF